MDAILARGSSYRALRRRTPHASGHSQGEPGVNRGTELTKKEIEKNDGAQHFWSQTRRARQAEGRAQQNYGRSEGRCRGAGGHDPIYREKLALDVQARKVAPVIEQMLWAYAFGKPKDVIEFDGRVNVRDLDYEHMTDEELKARLRALLAEV
jgi:hypothetical protein